MTTHEIEWAAGTEEAKGLTIVRFPKKAWRDIVMVEERKRTDRGFDGGGSWEEEGRARNVSSSTKFDVTVTVRRRQGTSSVL